MKNSRALFTLVCLIAAALFGAGFLITRQWVGFASALVLTLFSLMPERYYPDWMSVIQLIGFLMVASSGLLLESTPFLFIAGLVFALAVLEMRKIVFNTSEVDAAPGRQPIIKTHLLWLGSACLITLIICGFSLLLEFKIPFIFMVLIVLGLAFINYQLISELLKKTGKTINKY